MDETYFPAQDQSVPVAPVAIGDPPIPFDAFARTILPRWTNHGTDPRGRPIRRLQPGHPDEAYLTLLRIRHGREKHTPAEWNGLIRAMGDEPAHPAHPDWKGPGVLAPRRRA